MALVPRVLPINNTLPECGAIACNRSRGLLAFRDFPGCRNKAKPRKSRDFRGTGEVWGVKRQEKKLGALAAAGVYMVFARNPFKQVIALSLIN
jgi:hypothetical protein